jgi:hypothetical protein
MGCSHFIIFSRAIEAISSLRVDQMKGNVAAQREIIAKD